MNLFNKTIGKIINYSTLAKNILTIRSDLEYFIDVGCGNGNLIDELNENDFKCVGVDSKDLKDIYHRKDVDFHCADITKKTDWLNSYKNDKVIVHIGFCLINTFPKHIFLKTVKSILEKDPNIELLFEIQNKVHFQELYKENVKYKSFYRDIYIVSWNEHIIKNKELCKKVVMEYYSTKDILLNRTVDYLYSHDRNWFVNDKFFDNYNITELNWDIRNSSQMHCAHIYYLIRRKYD